MTNVRSEFGKLQDISVIPLHYVWWQLLLFNLYFIERGTTVVPVFNKTDKRNDALYDSPCNMTYLTNCRFMTSLVEMILVIFLVCPFTSNKRRGVRLKIDSVQTVLDS